MSLTKFAIALRGGRHADDRGGASGPGGDARRRAGRRPAPMRHQSGSARLFPYRRHGPLVRLRGRLLPRAGSRRPGRCREGLLRHAHGQDPLPGAGVGRGRHPLAQHDLDLLARRRPRLHLRRHQLLRRPGLSGPHRPRRGERHRARRRLDLHPDRHHHRAEPRGLLPRPWHRLRAGAARDQRRGARRLRGRALRRLHHGCLGPGGDEIDLRRSGRARRSTRRSSPRSRSGRWCATATTSGRISRAGC